MATDPKSATSADNSSSTSDNAAGQATSTRAGGPRRPAGAATEPVDATEPGATAAKEATEAVGEVLRQGQDAVLRSVEMGNELLTRLSPFALLTAGDRDEARSGQARPGVAAFPAAAWADGLFELVENALTTQRHYVDQVLAAQRQLVGQLLATGTSIATAGQAELARQSVSSVEEARISRN